MALKPRLNGIILPRFSDTVNEPIRTFVPVNAFIYNVGIREGHDMKKVYISLNEAEWRLLLYALNNLRSSLIAEGRYTDVVDEVMLKIINAPIRMIKAVG